MPPNAQYWFDEHWSTQVPLVHPQQEAVGQHWEPQTADSAQHEPLMQTDPAAQQWPLHADASGQQGPPFVVTVPTATVPAGQQTGVLVEVRKVRSGGQQLAGAVSSP